MPRPAIAVDRQAETPALPVVRAAGNGVFESAVARRAAGVDDLVPDGSRCGFYLGRQGLAEGGTNAGKSVGTGRADRLEWQAQRTNRAGL